MSAWTGDAHDQVLRHARGPLLPAVQARAAVLHRRRTAPPSFELGREVATLIPGHIWRKLQVRSRAQIAAWVTEHRPRP